MDIYNSWFRLTSGHAVALSNYINEHLQIFVLPYINPCNIYNNSYYLTSGYLLPLPRPRTIDQTWYFRVPLIYKGIAYTAISLAAIITSGSAWTSTI
jgi:hypothetical protein